MRGTRPPEVTKTYEPLRIMLGFVVRQCARRLGHAPQPEELAEGANNQQDERGCYRIFGRAISPEEARISLRQPERLVTVRRGPRWEVGDGGGSLGAGARRLPVTTGRAWSFADGLRASDVLPSIAADEPPATAARRLFAGIDPTLAARLTPGDVLVAGQQLGGGPGG